MLPDGSQRPPGPLRSLFLNKSVAATLETAVQPFGRGGLQGRYRADMAEHLREVADLRLRGQGMNVTVLWDLENMEFPESYVMTPREVLTRTFRWIAGVMDAPVTRVESVEFTRYSRTTQFEYNSGLCNWYIALRQLGGVVHRVWPRMTDGADSIILDRMRSFLDEMERGGPKRILVLLTTNMDLMPMLEAAQSEGVTVAIFAKNDVLQYYPGGCNFSVPIQFPKWSFVRHELVKSRLDPFRPPEKWLPEEGPPRYNDGIVALELAPSEELDRRVLHSFLKREDFTPEPARFDGTWVRPGRRLNDTLAAALGRAMARTGTMGTRTGRLVPEARAAVETDLADLNQSRPEDMAAVFWNFEDMQLEPYGPAQPEMLGRVVRWFEGMLEMPVGRVEVSKVVEPWERFGAFSQDWLYNMQNAGMVIHRVWPPKEDRTTMVLTRSVSLIAKAKEGGDVRRPRLICVVARELYLDEAMRAAQQAGISALWVGPEERGVYYPANSDAKVRIDLAPWQTAMQELAMSVCNPFTPGCSTPDAPAPVASVRTVPVDVRWGRAGELDLDSAKLQLPRTGVRALDRVEA